MRNFRATGIVLFLLTMTAVFTARPALAADEKASITVVLPTTDEFFKDLKFAFDLVKDDKGYKTLENTIQLFLVGVNGAERPGVRVFFTPDGLPSVLSFPVKTDADFKKLISNLWDLDVKTAPAPTPQLERQIPKAVRAKMPGMKLAANERIIFGLTDAFLRFEAGYVHVGKMPTETRMAKGGVSPDIAKGHDLAILIDGKTLTPADRKKGFDRAKKELVGAIVKGDKEEETVFAVRKSITEHDLGELERFFVESSRIHIGWGVSDVKKFARAEIELEFLPGTALDKSADMLGETPDPFAGVSKANTVLNLSGNFALDPMRVQLMKTFPKLVQNMVKKEVADNKKLTDAQRSTNNTLADLMFEIMDGMPAIEVINGFVRCYANGDGTLTSIGAARIPNGNRGKFEKVLASFTAAAGGNGDTKVDTEGDVEIHKLSLNGIEADVPEFIGKDGAYMGIADESVWLASGAGALARLKKAIQEAKAAGPKKDPVVLDLFLKFGPFVQARDKYLVRNPILAAKPAPEEKKPDDGKKKLGAKPVSKKKAESLVADGELRKQAIDSFKDGKDTMTLQIDREGKLCRLNVQFEEALIRFVAKSMSTFVKENLED